MCLCLNGRCSLYDFVLLLFFQMLFLLGCMFFLFNDGFVKIANIHYRSIFHHSGSSFLAEPQVMFAVSLSMSFWVPN